MGLEDQQPAIYINLLEHVLWLWRDAELASSISLALPSEEWKWKIASVNEVEEWWVVRLGQVVGHVMDQLA